MKCIKKIYFLCLFGACLLLSNCQTSRKTGTTALKKIPAAYPGIQDTVSSAKVHWEEFFKDTALAALIREALTNNPDQLITLQKIERASASVSFAKGAMLPTVNANVSAAQRKYGLYTMDGAGNISTEITPGQIVPIHLPDYYAGFQASWEVDIWNKLRNKKKKALALYLSSVEGKNLVTTNLITQIALNYYELRCLDNQLAIVKETIKLQDDALQIVRIQKQTATANELAVNQFEAQLLNSKSLELEVLQKILETESQLNFLLGRFPQAIARDRSEFAKELPFIAKAGLPSELLRNRPDIRKAEFELHASEADVKSARAAFYPSLTITGALGYQAFKTAFLFSSPESLAYMLLGSLTAPLINRNAIKREFKNATSLQRQALLNYQKSIINGYMEVYNELAKIKSLESILEFKTQEAEVLTTAIETSSILFKTGNANYMEVLMAQRNSLNAKLDLVNTKKQHYHAVVNIYKALGGGWQ